MVNREGGKEGGREGEKNRGYTLTRSSVGNIQVMHSSPPLLFSLPPLPPPRCLPRPGVHAAHLLRRSNVLHHHRPGGEGRREGGREEGRSVPSSIHESDFPIFAWRVSPLGSACPAILFRLFFLSLFFRLLLRPPRPPSHPDSGLFIRWRWWRWWWWWWRRRRRRRKKRVGRRHGGGRYGGQSFPAGG